MDLYLKVRLARRGGMSERAAAGHFGISRASVQKMMRFSVPPGYQRTAQIKRPNLRESLAHLVGLIMRRVGGDASGAFRASFV